LWRTGYDKAGSFARPNARLQVLLAIGYGATAGFTETEGRER
jgi:hypothetical protein